MAEEPKPTADFSNHHQQIRGNLEFLFEALGIRELFEKVGLKSPAVDLDDNPTGNSEVQKNYEGIGTLSGGPNEENDGSAALVAEAENAAANEETSSKTSSSPRQSTSSKTSGSK